MPWDPHSSCYYQDPNGLPGYDEWKLRSPYDDDDYDEPEECDHADYEIDHDGRAECQSCDHTWSPAPEVIKAYDEAQRRYQLAWERDHSWWMRSWRWFIARLPKRPRLNDDIPF